MLIQHRFDIIWDCVQRAVFGCARTLHLDMIWQPDRYLCDIAKILFDVVQMLFRYRINILKRWKTS